MIYMPLLSMQNKTLPGVVKTYCSSMKRQKPKQNMISKSESILTKKHHWLLDFSSTIENALESGAVLSPGECHLIVDDKVGHTCGAQTKRGKSTTVLINRYPYT